MKLDEPALGTGHAQHTLLRLLSDALRPPATVTPGSWFTVRYSMVVTTKTSCMSMVTLVALATVLCSAGPPSSAAENERVRGSALAGWLARAAGEHGRHRSNCEMMTRVRWA